jgi:hypothetical protein
MADPLNSDNAPESGTGSDADRLSMSPLSLRNGGADPTDIGQGPLNLDFGPRGYDDNPREPSGPVEAMGAGETDKNLQAP